MKALSISGVGVGLRLQHFDYILANRPAAPWFELLADNYINEGGIALTKLAKICEHYPIAIHSVGISIASNDPLDFEYLHQLTFHKQENYCANFAKNFLPH